MFWWRGCAINAGKDDLVVEGRDIGSGRFLRYALQILHRRVAGSASAAARGRKGTAMKSRAAIKPIRRARLPPLSSRKTREVIDTSHLTVDEVVDEIVKRLRAKNLKI